MEEEKFVEEQIENIDIAEAAEIVVPVVDESIILATQDDIVATNIKEEEVFNVTISEDVGPHALKVVSDHSFGLPRQHSIGAIEDLREELDEIERLKTVYSDGKNQANYYIWDDENPKQENRIGYFVSVYQKDGVNRISICDSLKDEFGVTVSAAGFVGNQHVQNPRGSNYGLVVHSGVVAVKCETTETFKPGEDYVVSNKYGYAKKTDGTYGYLVNSVSTIDGVPHVIISLTTNSKPLQKVSEVAHDVKKRMENAEENIFVNRGTANDAYAIAKDALERVNNNNAQVGDKLGEIIDKVDSTVGRVDDLEAGVGQAQNSATNAESLAASLGNQALNASAEAIAQANTARQEAENARDEIYDIRDEFKAEVENAQSKAQKAQEDISSLVEEINPLSEWTDGVNKGISGFVTKSDENSTQLALISTWQTGAHERISGIKTQADENSASITSLASYVNKSCEVIDTWSKTYESDKDESKVYYVKDTKLYYYYDAGINQWMYSETASSAGLTESIAYVTQLVDENSSSIEQTASHIGKTYTTIKEWPADASHLDITRVYYAENTKKYYYYEEVKDENDVKKNVWVSKDTAPITHLSTSIATVEQKADNNSAQIQQIVTNESETAKTIAAIEAKATNNETKIANLTSYIDRTYIELDSWPDDISTLKTDEIYFVDAYVIYETIEKWNEAGLDITKVYYAEDTKKYYCYKEGVWVSQDTAPDGTEIPAYYYYYQDPAWRTTTDPADSGLIASIANVTQKANANEASIQGLTEWQGETNGSIAVLTQKADADGAIIESLVSNVNKYSVGEYSQANGLTHDEAKNILKSGTVFIPTSEHDETYSEGYTQEFSKGFYYTWNGVNWVESKSSGNVVFSDTYIDGTVNTPYWVVGDAYCETITTEWNKDGKDKAKMYYVTGADKHYYYYENGAWINAAEPKYKVGALYKWEDNQWVEVMTRESNMLSRSTSLIQQKANEITLSVTDVQGSLASLQTKVETDGAATATMLASVATQFKDADGNLIQIEGKPYEKAVDITSPQANKYYAVGSQVPYDVYTLIDNKLVKVSYLYYDGLEIKQPNTASIVAAVNNDGESIAAINADRINFNGYATFTDDGSGLTGISGDLIHTGTIAANDGTVKIDLGVGTAGISGRIQATSGYIGNSDNGFFICCVGLIHTVGDDETVLETLEDSEEKVLPVGKYYFEYEDKYYLFSIDQVMYINDRIIVSFEEEKVYTTNGVISDIEITETKPDEATLLPSIYTSHYSLSNNQWSYDGNGFGGPGVYLGPDGIGLGNGNFYVDKSGDLVTNGGITLNSISTDNTTISQITLENGAMSLISETTIDEEIKQSQILLSNGDIKLTGSIAWDLAESLICVLYANEGIEDENGQPFKPNSDIYEDAESDSIGWHTEYHSGDLYVSYSYDGGKEWTEPIRMRGEDGESAESVDVESVLIDKLAYLYGITYTTITGTSIASPKISSPKIESGTITSIAVNSSTINGGTINGSLIDGARFNGGDFYGGNYYTKGLMSNTGSGYYLYNSISFDDKDKIFGMGTQVGFLGYDIDRATTGTPSRVFLGTSNGTALKLVSAAGISLEAAQGNKIYLESDVVFSGAVTGLKVTFG